MKVGRLVLLAMGIVVAVLALLFLLLRPDDANRVATAVSTVTGVAGLGIAIWAAWPTASRSAGGVRVSRTGKATAGAAGKANTGFSRASGPLPPEVSVDRTGNAEGGESANTGVDGG